MPTERDPMNRGPERKDAEEPGSAAPRDSASEDGSPRVDVQLGEDPGTVEDDEPVAGI